MLNKILKLETGFNNQDVLGVIVSPTQELALQTYDVVKKFQSQIPSLKTILFVGGY